MLFTILNPHLLQNPHNTRPAHPHALTLIIPQPQRLPPTRRARIKVRFLRQTGNPRPMPRLLPLIIPTRIVDRDAIIPQRGRARRPLEPHLDVDVVLIHIIQVPEKEIGFRFVEPDDRFRHRAVHEERFPPRGRVHSHERVDALDVLGPRVRVGAVEVFVRGDVDCVSAVDDLAEFRREFGVGGVAAGPEGVAAEGGHGVVVEVGDSGGVFLVHQVPGSC